MRPTYRRPTVEEDMNMPGSFPRFEELAHRLEGTPRPELLMSKRDDVGKSSRSTAISSGSGPMTPTFSRQSSQPMSNASSQQSRNTVRFDLPNLTDDEMLSTGYETDSMCSQLSTTTQASTVGSDIGVGDKMSARVRDPYYLTAAFVPPRQPSSQPSVPPPSMAAVQHDRVPVTRVPSPPTHQTGPRLARSRSAVETQPRVSHQASERPQLEARSVALSATQNSAFSAERSRKDAAEKFQTLDAGTKSIRRDQTMSTRDSHGPSDKPHSTSRYKETPQKESLTGRDMKDQQLRDLGEQLRDLGEQRKMLDEIRRNFESQKGTLIRVEKERNELKEAKDVLESKVAMLERGVTNLEKSIGSVERDKDKLRRNHQDEKDSLVKQMTSLQLANEALKARVDAKDKELLGLITSQNKLQGESDKRLAQVDLLTASHDALQHEQEPLRARIYGLGSEKKDLLHNLDVKNDVIDELQRKIGDLETEKGELQLKVVDVDQVKDDMRKAFDLETNDLVAQHDAAMDQMKKQVEDLTIELDGAKFANISLASQILDADKMRSEMKAAMDTAEAETKKTKEDMKAVQDENEKLTARINELQDMGAAHDVDGLRARIQDLEARVNDTKKEEGQDSVPSAAETEAEKPKAAEAEVQVVVVEPDKSAVLSAVKAQLEAVTKGLHDQIEKITNLEAERAALDLAKSELEAKEKEFTTQKTDFESSKASLEEKAGQLEGLTERNTALAAQLQTTEDQLAEAKAGHATMEAKMAELKNQILVLQGQLAFVSPEGLATPTIATPAVPVGARSPRSTAGSVAESTKRSRSASLTRKKKALSTISTMSAPAAERLVLLRSPADRSSIAVVRRSDLHAFKTPKSPRSRSRSRSVAPDSD